MLKNTSFHDNHITFFCCSFFKEGFYSEVEIHSIEYLFVFLATFQCSDLILVQISWDCDTFGNLGRRGRSLKNTFILLRV